MQYPSPYVPYHTHLYYLLVAPYRLHRGSQGPSSRAHSHSDARSKSMFNVPLRAPRHHDSSGSTTNTTRQYSTPKHSPTLSPSPSEPVPLLPLRPRLLHPYNPSCCSKKTAPNFTPARLCLSPPIPLARRTPLPLHPCSSRSLLPRHEHPLLPTPSFYNCYLIPASGLPPWPRPAPTVRQRLRRGRRP